MNWKDLARGARTHRLPEADRAVATLSLLVGLVLAGAPFGLLAAGDVASGQRLYQTRCLGCHGSGGGTENTLGPSLVGIIGRKAGTEENGVHSRAMTESGITWNEAWLRIFLAAPTGEMPGTTMPLDGLSEEEVDDLIAYLKTLR